LDAFILAKSAIEYTYTKQTPVIDDNGNGVGNDTQDGNNSKDEYFGNGILSAGDLPSFSEVSPSVTLDDGETTATIYAENVTDADGIAEVWAVITPPSHSSDPDDPVLTLPILEMNSVGGDRYEGEYTEFTENGTYNIAVYAMDTMDIISFPVSTTVIQSAVEGYSTLDSSLKMDIPCVDVLGTCYQVALDFYSNPNDVFNLYWKLDLNSIGLNLDCSGDCASLDTDFTITVSKIKYDANLYEIILNQYLNPDDPLGLYWILDLTSIKAI